MIFIKLYRGNVCRGGKREGLFSRATRRALNPTFDVTELPGIQRVEITVNGFRVFARICIPIYSTENISFFFCLRFYRIDMEISFFDDAKITVSRKTNDRNSFEIDRYLFPFLDSLRATILLSRKDFLDQSRTTILLLFRLLLFHSKKLDAIFESEAIQSIFIWIFSTNSSTSDISNIVLNAVITFF